MNDEFSNKYPQLSNTIKKLGLWNPRGFDLIMEFIKSDEFQKEWKEYRKSNLLQ